MPGKSSVIVAVGLLLASAQVGWSDASSPSLELARSGFALLDTNENGEVTRAEFTKGRLNVFLDMDADNSALVTYDEFIGFESGWSQIAADRGLEREYLTAMTVIFELWDINQSGWLSMTEQNDAVSTDFQRADASGDGKLVEEEFLNGFSFMIALRSVFKVDEV